MSYVIVGIHGLANKPPAKVLEKWWRQAILEGLARNCGNTEQMIEFTIVYWAHNLHDPLQDPGNMDEPYVKAEGSGPLKTYKDGWCDDVVAGVLGIAGLTLDAAKRYLGISELADRVLHAKLNDLSNYYKNRKIREKLRSTLETKLKALKGKRVMLIAHSMGSIIAYDVLRIIGRKDPNYRLDHFVTIGSPLGLPHVKDRIYRENHLVRTPTVVRKWTNFSERRDPVALDVHLANDYEPNDHGIQVKDDLIINGYVGKGGEPNYHKSYGYLRTPELSKAVRSFI
ncbi:MAG: esterase/lipase family protein [Terriglobia bacterium]